MRFESRLLGELANELLILQLDGLAFAGGLLVTAMGLCKVLELLL